MDALLHLDGEVRRHAEPRFLVEATLTRLAVEAGEGGVVAAPVAVAVAAPVAVAVAAPVAEVEFETPQVLAPVAGWSEVLEKLNRTVRAAYLDAKPEVDGTTLILWFRYGFHHKKAQEQSMQLIPHVKAWLGEGVKIEYRLLESTEQSKAARPASPEDDPFVREVVRRFDGRVTRVKEVTE
jgi:hypothetical protein